MKKMELLTYIGEIDDRYLAECNQIMEAGTVKQYTGQRLLWRRAAVLMTVLVVFFTSVITVEAVRMNQTILRYQQKGGESNYWFWADTDGIEDPVPTQIDVRYTIPELPEEFHLTMDSGSPYVTMQGIALGAKESQQKWENWRGHSIVLRQYVLTMKFQIEIAGELKRVKVGEHSGYLCKGIPDEVLVWATNEYLFVLELSGSDATELGLEDLAESILPEDSVQSSEEEEKEDLDLNLKFDLTWNYKTIGRHVYIDNQRYVHFSSEFLAEVPEAAQYEQRQGAIAVWNMRDTTVMNHADEEVFILWDDGTVTFLHISEENFRKKYNHGKEPKIIKITEDNGYTWYHLDDIWQEFESRLMRWRAWEQLLEGKKVAWIFGDHHTGNHTHGMMLTNGTLIYFPRLWYMIDMDTGKPIEERINQTTCTVVKPAAGTHFITTAGRSNILTQYGVVSVAYKDELRMVWERDDIVQANSDLILRSDGRLEIKKESEKKYRALDEQYVRIFPDAGYGLTVDNRLIRYAEFVDGPDEITLKEGGELDQCTDDLVVVYKDGTIQYPADAIGADWLATISKVRTLTHFTLSRLPEVEEDTVPVPKGTEK